MKFNKKLLLMSSAPHIRAEENARSIMLDVIIALMFPLIMGTYFFGWRALSLTVVSVASSVFFEFIYRLIMKKPQSVGDLSAVITGMMIALCLPVTTPIWIPVVGAFFAIVIVKQLYGGIGKNFLNPALAARAVLFSWPAFVSVWTKPGTGAFSLPLFGNVSPDVITSPTPLGKMKEGLLPSLSVDKAESLIDFRDVVVGNVAGCIGEVSAVVIVAALIYLLVRKVITIHIPLAFIGTVALLTYIFPQGGNEPVQWMLYSVCSGGLLFGAVFMATDYTTSPITGIGKLIYGVGCGVITVVIRYFGEYNEGVTFAILIMNCCACFIDRVVRPRRFGARFFERKGSESK
ncbi:MAG: RnfABCDGE type electron transport complex subunit D [Oscillospiraceae bacterium]|nr:RnfABCDGE type electron transport complex subunit D [Oscillospiraceae bacterium]